MQYYVNLNIGLVPITNMFDINGNETLELNDVCSVVAKIDEVNWVSLQVDKDFIFSKKDFH